MIQTFLHSRSIKVFVLLTVFAAVNYGQDPTGTLRGVVTDEEKAIIPGAAIELTDALGAVRRSRSLDDGSFVFEDLPAGRYTLIARKEGFAEKAAVIDFDGIDSTSDVALTAGSVNETVTIVLDSADAAV
jgi:hypothetical protein